jgi:non-ribosomal peptide synthetase-like protein
VLRHPVEVVTADPVESSMIPARGRPPIGTEAALAEVLADIVHVDRVGVDSHFFDDLGADSMVMAQFCARLRKRADLPSVSMKDVYRNPTIRSLAATLPDPAPRPAPAPVPAGLPAPTGRPRYVLCGLLQLLIFLGYSYLAARVLVWGYEWTYAGYGSVEVYLRAVLVGAATFVGLCALPILAKWTLIGRWKPHQIRVWSLAYVRFWLVKTLIRSNPLVLFVGSPLYCLYLRALGARVGRGVAIFTRTVPVCTDLLAIGDGTVIRKDSLISCYRAEAGVIRTGAVTLGRDVFVGELSVIDIDTSLGDGAQLGHTSSLHPGQAVPAGERWHGSPAQRTEVNYRTVPPAPCGVLRRAVHTVLQLLTVLVLYLPLAMVGLAVLRAEVPQLAALLDTAEPPPLTSTTFYLDALAASLVVFFGPLVVGLVVLLTVPRLLNLALQPDRVYPLYGFHHWVQRTVTAMTNVRFFAYLFGDSSYIVGYLRALGYDLSPVVQTGSNFGQRVKHGSPFLSTVGSGTMVADGLSLINVDYSSTSFRLSRASIGRRNFVGNNIAYPAQGRTGENCLLATKVMIPIEGQVRQGVGLLGSPCFEIPRSVQRDVRFDLEGPGELRRRLAAKNRHNIVTMGLYLLVRWIFAFLVTLLVLSAAGLYPSLGAAVIVLTNVLVLLFGVGYFVLVERAVRRYQVLRPLGCSIYDPAFWRHERFWKVPAQAYLTAFNGTPFKNVIWRLLGVRIGRRVFDDGCGLVEKTFVTVGDECTLNVGSQLQCHSQEDGAFKSDRITLGAGCTLGVGAFVHYGVTMGEGAVLAADSFLMKGEEIPPHARWGGNPARETRDEAGCEAVRWPVAGHGSAPLRCPGPGKGWTR